MINDLKLQLKTLFPQTCTLLASANLVVDESVSRIILHGSRGPKGGFRPDSDIDFSLIIDSTELSGPELEAHLDNVSKTTLSHWNSQTELDLAVIFDIRNCGLKCFDTSVWNKDVCKQGGTDCFGIYKTQRGFNGLVVNAGIQVRLMYPCIKIWQNSRR